jgi:outer membrane protein assembly factor BamB
MAFAPLLCALLPLVGCDLAAGPTTHPGPTTTPFPPGQPVLYTVDSNPDDSSLPQTGFTTALDITGKVLWRVETGMRAIPPLLGGTTLCVAGATDGFRSSLVSGLDRQTGRVLWRNQVAGSPWGAALAGDTCLVSFGAAGAGLNRRLDAYDLATGKLRWSAAIGDEVAISGDTAVIWPDGDGTSRGSIAGLNAGDGVVRWTAPLSGLVLAIEQGVILSTGGGASGDDSLIALSAVDGKQLWTDAGHGGDSSRPVVRGGVVYAFEARGLTALRLTDGARLWTLPDAHFQGNVAPGLNEFLGDGLIFVRTVDTTSHGAGFSAVSIPDGTRHWSAQGVAFAAHAGTVYALAPDPPRAFPTLVALSERDGTSRWSAGLEFSGPNNPTIFGEYLFIQMGVGGLLALRAEDGRTLWEYRPGEGVAFYRLAADAG